MIIHLASFTTATMVTHTTATQTMTFHKAPTACIVIHNMIILTEVTMTDTMATFMMVNMMTTMTILLVHIMMDIMMCTTIQI